MLTDRRNHPDMRGPLVVKVGGALLDEPGANRPVIEALAAIARQASGDGGLVLVHGGGVLVDRQLTRLGIRTERIDGIRVTPPDVVEEIVGVLAGRVNTRLVGLLQACGAPSVGLSLSDGGLCRCRKATHYPFDPGAVGEIVGGDATVVRALLDARLTPIVSSIGLDDTGAFLNVNADDAAAALAGVVGARELVLLTDVPGVLDASGRLLPRLDRDLIVRLIAEGTITGGMTAKVRGALAAAERTGVPVTIASWKDPTSICGTDTCTRIEPSPVAVAAR